MSNTSTLEHEYVQQREFDIYIQNIKERADIDRELTAARFDKFEAVMEQKIADLKGEINSISTAIEGLLDRFDDMKDYQNKWFTVFGILFTAAAIIAPVAVALIQKFVK